MTSKALSMEACNAPVPDGTQGNQFPIGVALKFDVWICLTQLVKLPVSHVEKRT